MATHLTWPFLASVVVGTVFFIFAHPIFVQTTRVTSNTLQCEVDERFVAAYAELNQVLAPRQADNATFFPSTQERSDELPVFPTFK